MSTPQLLMIEDDTRLAQMVGEYLTQSGFGFTHAADGVSGIEQLQERSPDLVILDLMLPDIDGLEVCRRIRALPTALAKVSVLMLTAKGDPMDRIVGLELGADDYLPKPFELTVLLARVKGLIRRRDWARGAGEGAGLETARVGEAVVDFRTFEVSARGETVRLTLLEAMLLKLLVQNAGHIVSKAEILEKVWNVSPDTETRAVDNFIMRLRRVLETNPRFPKHLHTVRGAGYRLVLEA
jgi:DNA-binding response OmpR family regulator